ncbi:hypothetical protein GH714_034360 [Hevea brasiliensis]|uniref:non-specific serine/threonine protein kinase n=1 Tax=Hevea brasiliensis TaxID=3981 RepID=A0A6A6MF02_HEVBR|nr:hypothetical protein GH714_034360 [Hevea brasiliensis]
MNRKVTEFLYGDSYAYQNLLICVPSLLPPLVSKACHPVDKEALLDFKHRIISDPSELLNSWTVSSNCCTSWDGVACDVSGRVVNVSRPGLVSGNDFIEDTYMSGTLSLYLGNLSSLQLLDLSNLKDLKGPIPREFGKLSQLTYLFLDSNKLTGSIPMTFGYLSQMKKLYLSDNFISGSVPASVARHWTSVLLGLSGNLLSGPIPSTIGKWIMITKIDLHGNNFSGRIPAGIGNLKNLKFLDLSENKIGGSIPPSIGGLSELILLYLNENHLTGRIPSSISGLTSMQFCRLSDNKLTGKIPSSFGNLLNLQTLDLSRNQLSGQLPPQLAKLQRLQTLDLSFNPLGLVEIPNWFQELKLFRLILAKTGIEGQLPHWLASSSLSVLDLSSNSLSGNYLIGLVLKLVNNGLSGKIPVELGDAKKLSTILISRNKLIGAIPEKVINLNELKEFDVSSNRLRGRIPTHKAIIPVSAFKNNPGLCGAPLPPC